MRRWLWIQLAVLGCLGLYLGGCEDTSPEAMELLRLAQTAEPNLEAEGRMVVKINRPDRSIESQATIQRWPGVTRIRYEDGPAAGQEIVREGNEFRRRGSDGRSHYAPRWGLDTIRVEEITRRNYEVRLGKVASIAGQTAREVVISPGEGGGAGSVRLWIDPKTGMVLGRTREDRQGRVLSSSQFLEVKYGRPSEEPPHLEAASGSRPQTPLEAGEPTAPLQDKPERGAEAAKPAGPDVTEGKGDREGGQDSEDPSAPAKERRGDSPPKRALDRHRMAPESGYRREPGKAREGGKNGEMRRPRRGAGTDPARPRGTPPLLTLDELSKALGFSVSLPTVVPAGFQFRGAFALQENRKGALHFSDGVRFFSVSVTRRPGGQGGAPQARGADKAVITHWPRRTVALAVRSDLLYVVHGPFPEETLKEIAASIP